MQLSQDERYKLLQKHDQRDRAMLLLQIINRQIQFAQIKHDIQNQTRRDLDQQQREYFLHQQIKNIQSELGEGENSDVVELERKAQKLNMPQKVADTFKREIDKFKKINPQSPDYSIQLNYLQTIVALPWGIGTNDNLNIKNAERVLERDHYGMER